MPQLRKFGVWFGLPLALLVSMAQSRTSPGVTDDSTILGPLTAFDEVAVAELTPLVQLQFLYGVNSRLVTSVTAGTGSASVAGSLLSVSTGTTTASDSLLRSVLNAKYQPGQGVLARWTAVFQSSGTPGTEAVSGYGNEEDGFFFGYDGDTFGVLHRSAGEVEYQTMTVDTAAVTASGTITITLDGTATEVEVVQNDTVQAIARAIGAVTFTGWETQVIGDDVVFVSHLAEAKAGAFSYTDTDTTGSAGSFFESVTGVVPTDTWIPQSTWNKDRLLYSTDPANSRSGMTLSHAFGNVYQVQLQWLGFGEISFAVENPITGRFVIVHTIQYANSATTPSVQNPTLPLYMAVKNGGTTTDIVVQSLSMAAFTEGGPGNGGLLNSAIGTATGDLTTETSILCIKNKPVFQGKENRIEFDPLIVTFAANGAGAAKFTTLRVNLNPVLGGDPVFTDVSTATSPMAFDVAGTTLTGGADILTFEFGADVEELIDLTALSIKEAPGALLCFSVQIDGGTSDVDVGVTWRELH